MLARMFGRWLCRKQKAVLTPEEEELHERRPGAYLTIFMYFVQVPALLKVEVDYFTERDEQVKEISSYIAKIFRFDALGYVDSCLIKNITPVEKTFYKTLFIAFLFLALFVMYVICGIFRTLCRCGNFPKDGCGLTRLPNGARFLGAFVLLVLYTYEFLSESLFSLLKCVHIHSLGKDVLYIDGNYICMVTWQYWVLLAVCLYIVPLFFIMSTAPVLVKEQKINLFVFVLSLFFPLLALPFILFMFVKLCMYGSGNDTQTRPRLKRFGAANFVVNLVAEPYKLEKLRGLCWEGIIIFRRLVLVIIATLVPSMILKHVLLVIACLLIMMVHVRVQPFKRFSSNLLETASLLILLCIAIMNLMKAVYVDSGEIPRGSAETLLRFYDIIEQSFVTFFPLVILLFILFLMIIRIVTLPCDLIGRKHSSGNEDEVGSQKSGGSSIPSVRNALYNGSGTPVEGGQLPHQLAT